MRIKLIGKFESEFWIIVKSVLIIYFADLKINVLFLP